VFKNAKVFLAGFLSCLLLSTGIAAAAATDLVDIKAQLANTVKFKLFGKDFAPKDAAEGTYVKPIAYKGKNYLPVRTLAEALGVPIDYDAGTKTIWIGGISRNIAVNDKSYYENYQNTIVTKDAALLSTPGATYDWGITNEKIMKNGSNFHYYLKTANKFNKFKTSLFLDNEIKKDLVVEFRKNDKKGEVLMSVTMKPGETKDIELDIAGVEKISVYAFIETPHGQLTRLIFGEPTLINELTQSNSVKADMPR
jgi:hypothetical protein